MTILILIFQIGFFAQAGPSQCFGMKSKACEIFQMTNKIREERGLESLRPCKACIAMAQSHSEDMAERDYFSHDSPPSKNRAGESFLERAERYGLAPYVGENIAYNAEPEAAIDMWMNSKAHRENMLDPGFKYLGAGFAKKYSTLVFWRGKNP